VATIFDKLNLKDQQTLVVINSPHSFDDELRQLKGVKIVRDSQGLSSVEFAIAFVTQRKEVDRAARKQSAATYATTACTAFETRS